MWVVAYLHESSPRVVISLYEDEDEAAYEVTRLAKERGVVDAWKVHEQVFYKRERA